MPFIWFKIVILKLISSLPVLRSKNKSRNKKLTGNALERKKKARNYNFSIQNFGEIVTANCSLNYGWGKWRSYATFVTFLNQLVAWFESDTCVMRVQEARAFDSNSFFRALYGEWDTKMPPMKILVLRIVVVVIEHLCHENFLRQKSWFLTSVAWRSYYRKDTHTPTS